MNLCDNDLLCPVCSQSMRLPTIRRVPGEQTFVLQCKPCGLSTTSRSTALSLAILRTEDAPQGGLRQPGRRFAD
jgi:hypothetical protein